jgi:hypothetical protein
VDWASQESAPSDPDCVTITGPPPAPTSAPQSLGITALGTTPESLLLQWQAPASGQAVGYFVERRLGTAAWERLTSTLIPALEYTDDSVPLGDVCYRIVAQDAFQQESIPSNEACTTLSPPPPPPAPSAPDTLLASLQGTDPESVALSWPVPTSGLPPVAYAVYRSVGGGAFTMQADSLTTTSWIDSLLIAGTSCYQVAAFDSLGREGEASTSACVTWTPPLGPPPGKPLNVVAALTTTVSKADLQLPTAAADTTAHGTWTFDEGAGDDALDSSGRGHDGYLGSSVGPDGDDPTWTTGRDGSALQFAGSHMVTVPDTPALRLPGSFTVEAWVFRTSNAGAQVILSKGDSDQRNFWLRLRSNGTIDFRWETDGGRNHGSVSSASVPLNEWHHVASVYDMQAGENRLYIDGVLVDTSSDSGVPTTSIDPLLIGTRLSSGSPKDYFIGSIDLVRVSSGAIYIGDFTPPESFGPPAPKQMVQISWDPPGEGTPAGYRIYRSIDAAPQVLLTDALVTSTSWNDLQPVMGLLSYKVSAVDAFGQEGPQSADSAAVLVDDGTPPPPPAPSAPLQLVAALEDLPGGSSGDAAYRFDENGGQEVLDASGNAIHGTLGDTSASESSDPSWTSGVVGSALQFDGIDDRVTIPDAPALHQPGSFTIEAWVWWASGGQSGAVISKGDSDQRNYWLRIGSTGIIDFRWETSSGSNHGTDTSDRLTPETWHHVACVYDQQAGEDRIYIDGVLVETNGDSGTPATSSDPLHLGARLSSGSLKDYFNGRVDLVRISSGAVYTDNFTPPTSYGSGGVVTVAQLSWAAPESGIAVSYNVSRSSNGGAWQQINTQPVTQLSFTDSAPVAGENCYRVTAVDDFDQEGEASADECVSRTVSKVAAMQPQMETAWTGPQFGIHPNPFNPQTRISFRLPDTRHVLLRLYDVRGRQVATLDNGTRSAGMHVISWNGRSDRGLQAGTGTYFLVLQAGDIHETRKLIVVK